MDRKKCLSKRRLRCEMKKLAGYDIQEVLKDSKEKRTYLAQRANDGKNVVIKQLKLEFISESCQESLRREFEITHYLNIDSVRKSISLEGDQEELLVLEYRKGITLAEFIKQNKLSLLEKLLLFRKILAFLECIHQKKVLYKEISFEHIIISPESGKLIFLGFRHVILSRKDFGGAAGADEKNWEKEYLEECYSLGVLLYQLLMENDFPLDTKKERSFLSDSSLSKNFTKILEIIAKLLSKEPTECYLSMQFVSHDIDLCCFYLIRQRGIPDFVLGVQDTPQRFKFSSSLYGREGALQQFQLLCKRCLRKEKGVVFLEGWEGSGKRALVQKFGRIVATEKGTLVEGSFSSGKETSSYHEILKILSTLIQAVLREPEERREEFKAFLQEKLSFRLSLLIGIFPELTVLFPHLKKEEDQDFRGEIYSNRWFLPVVINIFTFYINTTEFLVVHICNASAISWEEAQILQSLLKEVKLKRVMFVFSVEPEMRENLKRKLGLIEREGFRETISLGPLNRKEVSQWLSDSFRCDPGVTLAIAEIIVNKTGGFPFFMRELIFNWHQEHLFYFDHGVWEFDLEKIVCSEAMDNMEIVIRKKTMQVDESSQKVLSFISCFEEPAEISFVESLMGIEKEKFYSILSDCMEYGILNLTYDKCSFFNEKLREYFYFSLTEEEKMRNHSFIAKKMFGEFFFEEETESEIVKKCLDHVLPALPVIEKIYCEEVSRILLFSIEKMKLLGAFSCGLKICEKLLEFLGKEDIWELYYATAATLYSYLVEFSYLLKDYEGMRLYCDILLQETKEKELFTRVFVQEILIEYWITQGNSKLAFEEARKGLGWLNVDICWNATKKDFLVEFKRTNKILKKKQNEFFPNSLPEIKDPRRLAILRVLTKMVSSGFQQNPFLSWVILTRAMRYVLLWGKSSMTPFIMNSYAALLCGAFRKLEEGYRMGECAVACLKSRNNLESYCRFFFVYICFILHWKLSVKDTLDFFYRAYLYGVENGDYEYGAFCLNSYLLHSYFSGVPLKLLWKEKERLKGQMLTWDYHGSYLLFCLYEQMLFNLMFYSKEAAEERLSNRKLEGDKIIPDTLEFFEQTKDEARILIYRMNELFLSVLFDDFELAYLIYKKLEKQNYEVGIPILPDRYFYSSIVLKEVCQSEGIKRKEGIKQVHRYLKKWQQWNLRSDDKLEEQYHTICGIYFELQGRWDEAVCRYAIAAEIAEKKENFSIEALNYLLLFRLYRRKGEKKPAAVYLNEALSAYEIWGADAVVFQLEKKYRDFLFFRKRTGTKRNISLFKRDFSFSLEKENWLYFASMHLSKEKTKQKLIQKFLSLSLSLLDAERGILFLTDDSQKLRIASVVTTETDEEDPGKVFSKENDEIILPQSLIDFVYRSEKMVRCDGLDGGSVVSHDSYIEQKKPRSIACFPLIHNGKVEGVVYFENLLLPGIFTEDKVRELDSFLPQVLILLENIQLYEKEREENQERLKIEERLRESEKKYKDLTTLLPQVVFEFDRSGRFTYCNKFGLEMFEFTEEDFERGIFVSQLFVGDDLMQGSRDINKVISGEGKGAKEYQVKTKTGKIIPVVVYINPILQGPQIVGIRGILIDITQQKKTEREINQLNRELEQRVKDRTEALSESLLQLRRTQTQLIQTEKLASLGGLVAGISHEINTPVGIGITAVSYIAEESRLFYQKIKKAETINREEVTRFTESVVEYSAIVMKNLERAATQIRSFKEVAVNQTNDEIRTFELRTYLDQICISLSPKVKKTPHTIHIDCSYGLILKSYPGVISQVFSNLILNSIIHGFEHKGKGEIRITVKEEREKVEIVYSDDGCGISKENLDKIYDPFFTTKRGLGGTGLGLNIVYNLITGKLGGEIKCVSKEGEGTTFYISIQKKLEKDN